MRYAPPASIDARRRAGLAALCATALAPAAWSGTGTGPVAVGARLPDVRMSGLNGPDRQLSTYFGQPLLINVWAGWCGPCRQETASLERLAWLPTDVPFAVIGISTDDHRERAVGWLAASRATISHFIDRLLQLETMLGASRLPLTVLVDARGRVLTRHYGAKEWDAPPVRAMVRRTFLEARGSGRA